MALGDTAAQERTEQPTGRRREEARARGQIARSADLAAAVLLVGALGMYALAGPALLDGAIGALRAGLDVNPRAPLSTEGSVAHVLASLGTWARVVAPFVLVPAAASVLAQLLQTRFAVSPQALAWDWSRVSPARGLGRLLGLRSLVELAKAVLKLAAVAGVAWIAVAGDWAALVGLGPGGAGSVLGTTARVVGDLWLGVGVAYLGLAVLDYGWQWWQHERSLRMTREEVREEMRQTEGDPHLRTRLRALHRRLGGQRMLAEVARADVVLRNPTHVAVALRYDGGRMRAPRVVAKGARLLARRILEAAQRHGVPVVENPPLARALYRGVRVGAEIPPALYRAVAEVLAHVYALRGRPR